MKLALPRRCLLPLIAVLFAGPLFAADTSPPTVGEPARNFTLRTLDEKPIELRALVAERPVVIVVLRGWPGYQCPLCTKQVHDWVARAAEFKSRGVQVLMVYPGPADQLRAHAREFLADKSWPEGFHFVVDPDYTFTNAWGLRWNAPKETAYPATFVLERGGRIRFAHVSKTHGNRTSAASALAALP